MPLFILFFFNYSKFKVNQRHRRRIWYKRRIGILNNPKLVKKAKGRKKEKN